LNQEVFVEPKKLLLSLSGIFLGELLKCSVMNRLRIVACIEKTMLSYKGVDECSIHMGYRKVAVLLQKDYRRVHRESGSVRASLLYFSIGKPPTINSQKNRMSTNSNGRSRFTSNVLREIFGCERKHVVP